MDELHLETEQALTSIRDALRAGRTTTDSPDVPLVVPRQSDSLPLQNSGMLVPFKKKSDRYYEQLEADHQKKSQLRAEIDEYKQKTSALERQLHDAHLLLDENVKLTAQIQELRQYEAKAVALSDEAHTATLISKQCTMKLEKVKEAQRHAEDSWQQEKKSLLLQIEASKERHQDDLRTELERNALLQLRLQEHQQKRDNAFTEGDAAFILESQHRKATQADRLDAQAKERYQDMNKDLVLARRKASKLEERIVQLEKGLTTQGRDITNYKFRIAGLEEMTKRLTSELRQVTAQRNEALAKLRVT